MERKNKRVGRVRISMDIPESLHTEIKIRASAHKITLTAYVMRALFAIIRDEKHYQ